MPEALTPVERKGRYIYSYMTPETAKYISNQLNTLTNDGIKKIEMILYLEDGVMILGENLFGVHYENRGCQKDIKSQGCQVVM
jgi:hypothetical protein